VFNLIVTADETAWNNGRDSISLSRFGEYTAESIKARYRSFDDEAIKDLTSFPTLFAYEQVHDLPAKVGRVTKIVRPSGGELRFHYTFIQEFPLVSPSILSEIAWELDINNWEMDRTHWAIKDVDLFEVLEEHGIGQDRPVPGGVGRITVTPSKAPGELVVVPSVFAIPDHGREMDLVSVMMPFGADFANVFRTIHIAADRAGFRCQRADDIWESSALIQDVFSLIYRSFVVVVDLSGQNPNVMYEAGIAHTLGRPVIPIANSVEKLPFDLAHHRTLGYLPNGEGLEELTRRLERRLAHLRANSTS
jgi:hypothetical protein